MFKNFFKTPRDYKIWAQKILYPIARLGLFFTGVMRIHKKGDIKSDTRTIVINHLTMFDIVVIISLFDSSYLAMAGLKNLFFMRWANEIFNMVYVDRSKGNQGTTELICNLQNDFSRVPIVIFPEGKVTNGDALVGFRSGAYISETMVQPVAIRYRMWFTPRSMSTVAWNEDNFKYYLYQFFLILILSIQ